MLSAREDLPSKEEVERQAERIYASRTFLKKPTMVRLLERLVKSTLEGKPVTERELGIDVYQKSENWVTDRDNAVREGCRLLRKYLAEYYVRYGSEDQVLVTVHAYRAVFSYSNQSSAYRSCRLGYRALSKGDPLHARGFFNAAIKSDRAYAPAYVGLAECHLLTCLLFGYGANSEYAAMATELASQALAMHPGLWQAHTVHGAIHSFRREWDAAIEAFDEAKKINERGAEESPWYLMFLFAVGSGDSAVRIAESKMAANAGDPAAQTIFALAVYLHGMYLEAYGMLKKFEFFERADSAALVVRACAALALGQGKEAVELIRQTQAGWQRFPLVRGLLVLSLGWSEKKREARQAFAKLNGFPKESLPMALGQMGIGKGPEAVATLREAYKQLEPIMILGSFLPLLSPLLSLEEFQSLTKLYRPMGKQH